ncbi:MAG: ACP phosphodiesterase [Ginsengibacter sp.]
MNYLAHAYLSFNEPEILVGNLISDFVKGKKKFTYSPGIQKGIALHHAIDQFTDDHATTYVAKLFFKPAYRLYAGAFVDVVYDHFLANDINEFIFSDSLQKFSSNVYLTLENYFSQLPENFKYLFPFMKKHNWLDSYQYKWGIEKGFRGLANRAAYLSESAIAFSIFNKHYEELKNCYNEFFPQQKEFAALQLRNLLAD